MLIKLYTTNGTLHIIEEVRCVSTYPYLYHFEPKDKMFEGPQPEGSPAPVQYEQFEKTTECRIIDFSDELDVRRRILVGNKAYICNNNGKTVEVVQVS